MIEYFKDLPRKQKIGFICLAVAAIGFLFSIISGAMSPKDEPTPQPTTPVATSTPNPTASSAPSVSASPSASASAMPEIKYGENKIPVSEIRALQDVASEGIVGFLTWNANEKPEDRTKRISGYFVSGSEFPSKAPDFQDAVKYKSEDGQGGMVSLGSVDYINPVGGDESAYRVTMGTVLRAQYNYDTAANEKSGVVQSSDTITVDMTKVNGAWKIKTISQD